MLREPVDGLIKGGGVRASRFDGRVGEGRVRKSLGPREPHERLGERLLPPSGAPRMARAAT